MSCVEPSTFKELDRENLIFLFKSKFNPNLFYTIEEIGLDEIVPTSNYVYIKRLEYAEKTLELYKENNISLFKPVQIHNKDRIQFVAPPIVEVRGEHNVLCDGTHRVFTAKKLGIKSLYVLKVRNTILPLAGDLNKWENIQITKYQCKLEENFINFNKYGFTGYSQFCNSDKMIFEL